MSKQPSECDCCGEVRLLARCWAAGTETFACDECRGIEQEPDEEEGPRDPPPFTEAQVQHMLGRYDFLFGPGWLEDKK